MRRIYSNEFLSIALALMLFLMFPMLSRQVDATSAPVDPGLLSLVIMAMLSFLLFKALTWWSIKSIWPFFAQYSNLYLEEDFTRLQPLHKILIYLGFYLTLLMGFVFTLGSLA